jgi:hypothetical protein
VKACKGCGKDFGRRENQRQGPYERQEFCSRECKKEFWDRQFSGNTCDYCGGPIKKRVKDSLKVYLARQYCSRSCSTRGIGPRPRHQCSPDCTCGFKNMKKCEPGCTCGKHSQEVTYWSVHYHVRHKRGSASEYDCIMCEGPAKDWAWTHGTDGTDPLNHFRPMCRQCHWWYDEKAHRVIYTSEHARKIKHKNQHQER